MKAWRTAALAAALPAAAASGAALASPAHGQMRPAPVVRAVQAIGGGAEIGVSIRDVDEARAKEAGTGAPGVLVESVASGSPAETAGIREGDIIVEFDGERVRSARQLTRLVRETPPGRTVQAAVLRDGQRTSVSVAPRQSGGIRMDRLEDLAELGREFGARRAPVPPVPPAPPVWQFDELLGRSGRIGITVRALSPQLAEYFGVKTGVLVSSVSEGSIAGKMGLKAGDVITAVNGAAIDAAAELRRQLQTVKEGQEFTIAVTRDRKPLTLNGRMERSETSRGERVSL